MLKRLIRPTIIIGMGAIALAVIVAFYLSGSEEDPRTPAVPILPTKGEPPRGAADISGVVYGDYGDYGVFTAPAPRVTVELHRVSGDDTEYLDAFKTDKDGKFAIHGISEGRYIISAASGDALDSAEVLLDEDHAPQNVTLHLQAESLVED